MLSVSSGRRAGPRVKALPAHLKEEDPSGSRVLGLVQHAYAEYVVAPAEAWAPLPAKLDLEAAAALPLVALTGAQLIELAVAPKRGDVILVAGALGGVGRVAVTVAKELGAKVVAGVRKRQLPEAQKLGADTVIALDDPASLDRVPILDGVADAVGGETSAKLLPRLKKGGAWGSVVGEPPGAKEAAVQVHAMFAKPDARRLAALAELDARGELVLPIAKRLPLSQAREAQRFAQNSPGGKVLLLP